MQAARRRAIGELIFFAGTNDLRRCKQIASVWNIKVGLWSAKDLQGGVELLALPGMLQCTHTAVHICYGQVACAAGPSGNSASACSSKSCTELPYSPASTGQGSKRERL